MPADALDDLLGVIECYPEQRSALEAALGEDLLSEVLRARETLRRPRVWMIRTARIR